MLKTSRPPRGSFDYLLKGIDKQVWHDAEPPVPPERGGGPPRVTVNIEIVQPKAPPRRRRYIPFALVFLGLLVLLGLTGCVPPPQARASQKTAIDPIDGQPCNTDVSDTSIHDARGVVLPTCNVTPAEARRLDQEYRSSTAAWQATVPQWRRDHNVQDYPVTIVNGQPQQCISYDMGGYRHYECRPAY